MVGECTVDTQTALLQETPPAFCADDREPTGGSVDGRLEKEGHTGC